MRSAERWTATGVLIAGLLATAAPAQATAYRYWTYWTSAGSAWTFSQRGPASTVPPDGATEGWRFAVSTGTRGQGAQPRISPSTAFTQFCGSRTAPPGSKRVAVVFDFGTTAEAPDGQTPPAPRGTCVVIDAGATGGQVLAAAADIRSEQGLVCGIGGYPGGECAPAISTPTPVPTRSHEPDARGAAASSDQDERTPPPAAPADDQTTPSTSAADKTVPDSRDPGGSAGGGTRQARPSPGPSSPAPGLVGATPESSTPWSTPVESPVFEAADAHVADDADRSWWGVGLALTALVALAGYALWRRGSSRPR